MFAVSKLTNDEIHEIIKHMDDIENALSNAASSVAKFSFFDLILDTVTY